MSAQSQGTVQSRTSRSVVSLDVRLPCGCLCSVGVATCEKDISVYACHGLEQCVYTVIVETCWVVDKFSCFSGVESDGLLEISCRPLLGRWRDDTALCVHSDTHTHRGPNLGWCRGGRHAFTRPLQDWRFRLTLSRGTDIFSLLPPSQLQRRLSRELANIKTVNSLYVSFLVK